MSPSLDNLKDPTWRLSNLYKITDKNSRLLLLKPNAVQMDILDREMARESVRQAILKARQFGVTTFKVIRLLDKIIWGKNRNACILAHKADVLPSIFNIVRTAFRHLPEKLKPKVEGTGSLYEMRFPEINSKIYTTLEVRGGTIHDLHVSEAAFIPEDRLLATLDAVPLGGNVTLETTANGLNHFHDTWINNDSYDRLFYPWFFHAEYQIPTGPLHRTDQEAELAAYALAKFNIKISDAQIAFRRFKIKEKKNSLAAFLQEYPEDDVGCFLASGSNPFDAAMLMERRRSAPEPLREVGPIKVFYDREHGKTYVIGADPAEGVRRDNSAAAVWCVEDRRQVAVMAENTINPEDFAAHLYKMGHLFAHGPRWPTLCVERNNHGHAVILKLKELRYPNMWTHNELDEEIGHRTTTITRPLLIDGFVEAVNSGMFSITEREAFDECLTLVENKGKIEAEDGKKDDRVISNALAVKVCLDYLPKTRLYKNIDEAILI